MKFLPLVVVAVVGLVARAHAEDPPKMTREMLELAATMADKNKDGFIDKDEMNQNKPDDGGEGFKAMLAMGDANNDGKISKAEFVDVSMKMANAGPGGVGEPAPSTTKKPGGGASSMTAAFSLLSLLVAALSLF